MRFPSTPQPHPLGNVVEQTGLTVFFGDRSASNDAMATAFPDYAFTSVKQTHSDIVVLSPATERREGDAHFTRERKLALTIQTADCVPVMIHDPESDVIAAIHAGWRGVENEIVLKTCARINAEGANPGRARAWIGPHIATKSFEVGLDVAARLKATFEAVRGHSPDTEIAYPHPDPNKLYIDLRAIVQAQLLSCGFEPDRVTVLDIDTMTTPTHASFRRDRDRAGRNVTFIALK